MQAATHCSSFNHAVSLNEDIWKYRLTQMLLTYKNSPVLIMMKEKRKHRILFKKEFTEEYFNLHSTALYQLFL